MKIKEGYMLREVAGNSVVIPYGATTVDFNGMISLNDSAAYIWKLMTKEVTREVIVAKMLEEYDVSKEQADADVDQFIKKMKDADLIE